MSTLSNRRRRWPAFLLALALLLGALAALVVWLNLRGEAPVSTEVLVDASPEVLARGAYLARAGNCIGCHTQAGGAELAGGRPVSTPYGTVYSSNLTPDRGTGIGDWSADAFWRALHHGRSRDGRLLYPAFPYPNFTQLTREDSDALHVFLMRAEPVQQPNRPHALRFPYDTQAALAVWRALFFKPERFEPDAARSAQWNRGRYLVEGLGHCAACHSERNALGGVRAGTELAGGRMPDGTWHAPSLLDPKAAGFQDWPRAQAMALLRDGVTTGASVAGPMADVVHESTQHLAAADLDAMVDYLASLPVRPAPRPQLRSAGAATLARGQALYRQHCADCHGERGEGVDGIYPALAGNRAVVLEPSLNLVQVIRKGGFAPTTAGNPQPFGMPPFGQVLGNVDIAAVASYIRQSWGNSGSEVTALDVLRAR